jgi:DNA uptake protein ComE-like DNA-binding protein
MKSMSFASQLPVLGLCATLFLLGSCGESATPEKTSVETSPAVTASAPPEATAKIDVNKAPIAELDKLELPGTKPSLSERIQGARPYKTMDELVSKKAISQDELNLIKNLITLGETK